MDNYFSKRKFLLILFILSFLVFVLSAIWSNRAAFGDIPCEFFKEMILVYDNPLDIVYKYQDNVVRFWSYKLHRLFFYSFYFFSNNIIILSKLYIFSLIVVPFLLLFINYLISLRTKRFDIAIIAFVYYTFFEIPYISHATRECHVGVMLQFMFLSYFLSREKLGKADIFIIFILSIFLMESCENIVILGLLFLLFGILYYFKNPKDNKKNLIMGILGLLFAFYTSLKTVLINNDNFIISFDNSVPRWLHSLNMLPDASLSSCMILSLSAMIICFFLFFLKRNLNKKDFIWGIPYFVVTILLLYLMTSFIPDPNKESNFFIIFFLGLPILFIIILIYNYFDINIRDVFFRNILVIACIVGICQFIWQINSSLYCKKYTDKIHSSLIQAQKPTIVVHFNEDEQSYIYESNICTMFRGFMLYGNYNIKSTIVPDPEFRDYNGNNNYGTYYDYDNEKFNILDCPLSEKNKYWDISNIVEEYKK